jgi:hypothetical protein
MLLPSPSQQPQAPNGHPWLSLEECSSGSIARTYGRSLFNHNKMVFKLDCVIQITPMPVLAQKLKCSKRGDVVRFLI